MFLPLLSTLALTLAFANPPPADPDPTSRRRPAPVEAPAPSESLAEGVVRIESRYDVPTTTERLIQALESKELTHFATIDHAAGASAAGQKLRPTTLVLFGHPKNGTALMQQAQLVGLELPLRVLIYQDAEGSTFLAWSDVDWIASRHGATEAETLPALRASIPALLRQVAGARRR